MAKTAAQRQAERRAKLKQRDVTEGNRDTERDIRDVTTVTKASRDVTRESTVTALRHELEMVREENRHLKEARSEAMVPVACAQCPVLIARVKELERQVVEARRESIVLIDKPKPGPKAEKPPKAGKFDEYTPHGPNCACLRHRKTKWVDVAAE